MIPFDVVTGRKIDTLFKAQTRKMTPYSKTSVANHFVNT